MKKIIVILLLFLVAVSAFGQPWAEEEYADVPAMFQYGAWLNSPEDTNNMFRLLFIFARDYKDVRFSYEDVPGMEGNAYWVILDGRTFLLYNNKRRMTIILSDYILSIQDRRNAVDIRVLETTVNNFLR